MVVVERFAGVRTTRKTSKTAAATSTQNTLISAFCGIPCRIQGRALRHNEPCLNNAGDIKIKLKWLGGNFRRARVNHAITQKSLSERADLNLRTLQRIEAGQTNILFTTAIRLRNGIGCPWDELAPLESIDWAELKNHKPEKIALAQDGPKSENAGKPVPPATRKRTKKESKKHSRSK